jgi:GrpB-like predicted nucleotidyltransferase (UPF0157 family)
MGAPLERHPSLDERFDPAIRVVEHDPAWAEMAAAELRRVAGAFAPLATGLDHVGSTAVPGLPAKPIADLRDFLRAHPEEAAAYGALKRVLAERHPEDRLAYVASKDRYVVDLEARALDWAPFTGSSAGAPDPPGPGAPGPGAPS